jgi:3-phosphoshikimate 1-carboxyvinyltransferase
LGFAIEVAEDPSGEPEPNGTIRVRGGRKPAAGRERCCLSGTDIPGIIDELPALAVLGTQIDAGLEIRDAGELRYKETDRLAATAENLRRMGATVEERPDGLLIGQSELNGAVVDSFGDHRIAMAFAVAGLLAAGETEICGAECVDISFPGFFAALRAVAE